MRDENDKLFSQQSAERNSPDNRYQKLQGADVDRDSTEPEENRAGYEAMRNFKPGQGTNAQASQNVNAAQTDNQTGQRKENNLPETVSLDTEPIDEPRKLS